MPFDISEELINATEQKLGAKLPDSYRRAMMRSNGGAIEIADDVWELHPIADTSDRKRAARTANHIAKETEACHEWADFPAAALVIAANGSGDKLVLKRGQDSFDSIIYMWSHETGECSPIAADFSDVTF